MRVGPARERAPSLQLRRGVQCDPGGFSELTLGRETHFQAAISDGVPHTGVRRVNAAIGHRVRSRHRHFLVNESPL